MGAILTCRAGCPQHFCNARGCLDSASPMRWGLTDDRCPYPKAQIFLTAPTRSTVPSPDSSALPPRALLHKARPAPECGAPKLFRTAWSPLPLTGYCLRLLCHTGGTAHPQSVLSPVGQKATARRSCQDPTGVGTQRNACLCAPGVCPIQPSHSAT